MSERDHLSDDEVSKAQAEELPDREVMSVITPAADPADPVIWDRPVEPDGT